jgi:hypothetical protein
MERKLNPNLKEGNLKKELMSRLCNFFSYDNLNLFGEEVRMFNW